MLRGTMYNHIELACTYGGEQEQHSIMMPTVQLNFRNSNATLQHKVVNLLVANFMVTLSPIGFPFLKADKACKIDARISTQLDSVQNSRYKRGRN